MGQTALRLSLCRYGLLVPIAVLADGLEGDDILLRKSLAAPSCRTAAGRLAVEQFKAQLRPDVRAQFALVGGVGADGADESEDNCW